MSVLGPRALNRALLARQHLLARVPSAPLDEVEHLVGMQGQAPLAPYVGLWSRLTDFDPDELGAAVEDRRAVRMSLMRSTIHLVTARDAVTLRGWTGRVLARAFASNAFARRLAGIDVAALAEAGREILEDEALTRPALGRRLAERWPGADEEAMAYAVTAHVPLVQIPPRGVWRRTGPVAWTSMERWLGTPVDHDPDVRRLVIRYLGAFGPATVADIRAWSGVTRLADVIDALRPELATFTDDRGRELFDLPGAPRPDPDTPAPPRFLPEYDNVLLGHADRSRIIPPGRGIPLAPGNGASMGTILVDGMFAGEWRISRSTDRARLVVSAFEQLRPGDRSAVEDEGARLLAFAADRLDPEIVVEPFGT